MNSFDSRAGNISNVKKKSVLIQLEPRRVVSPATTPSRREVIRIGFAAVASGILVLPPFSSEARANPLAWLGWTGRTAFAAGIAWLVNRVLDKRFPTDPDRLGIRSVSPTPTTDRFHNSHADPYVVTNPRYNFKDEYSRDYRYYVGVSSYLRSNKTDPIPEIKDLATNEIKRIAWEESRHGTLLFPCGKRERPVQSDLSGYRNTCIEYGVDPARLKLDYVRPFNDGNDAFVAYGITSNRTGQKDLLISL